MMFARVALGLVMIAGVSACSDMSTKAPYEAVPIGMPSEAEMHRAAVSLAEPIQTPKAMAMIAPTPASVAPDAPVMPTFTPYKVVGYELRVPEELTVSEANLYYPIADIVWRGDAHGNRKEQVGSFFLNSLKKARASDAPGREVVAQITLARFHSLTEKTRYTVGGVHSITFNITLREAGTGRILVNNREVVADLKGFGGRRAMRAERHGQTMRVRIQDHLDRVIAAELSQPGGWGTLDADLRKAVDQI